MNSLENILDQNLVAPEDEGLNLEEEVSGPISKPVGVDSLREWGDFILEDGKHKSKSFFEAYTGPTPTTSNTS